MTFDYKKILFAYINYVGERAGRTFLERYADDGITGLSSEEVEELRRLDSAANE
jgi:hypothetical protein